MKIAVIGAGSTYTPELIQGFLDRREQFPLTELHLMDIDAQRLEVVGGFARRMAAAQGAPFRVTLGTQLEPALAGVQYAITQLRVGGMQARREDEYLGRRHGLIGQETTGVGGLAKALRTIPVLVQIANRLAQLAPGALLVNFTNPAGLITQALAAYAPETPAVGVCNVPLNTRMQLVARLEQMLGTHIAPERTVLDTLGLNHLSWHRGFTIDGEDLWPQVMATYVSELRAAEAPEFDPDWVESLGMIPNYYLQYYYHTPCKLAEQAAWPPSRAEAVMEVEAGLLRQYADPALQAPPPDLMKRGGAYYSTVAAQLLCAHANDLGETHVVNTVHAGAVPGWPAGWVLELPCRVDRAGIHPLPAKPLPPAVFGLVAQVKAYELLAVKAGAEGDWQAAYQALAVHPLGPGPGRARAVLQDLLETNRAYLPQFAGHVKSL